MEKDRAEANVGTAVFVETDQETKQEAPRHPVKRFVGRKTAAANAQSKAEANGHIEDGSAIQGFTCQTNASNASTDHMD